jgi:exodeoxyribonuclease V alpha subunit
MAVFRSREGFRGLPLRPLRGQLDLAYALTVHKAQGSEFDRIALVLPDHASPLLTREVVYTALTRARSAATILGARAHFAAAARATTVRITGLADQLA